ncbi:hypothetical protein [Clostridium puniceum]|nr:hypothetical protein [Clostridium puniceum]
MEIPEGKIETKIDTTVIQNVPIYEDTPLTYIEKINTQMAIILK